MFSKGTDVHHEGVSEVVRSVFTPLVKVSELVRLSEPARERDVIICSR